MKSAILIRDGRTQMVLTPENAIEEMALNTIEQCEDMSMTRGDFYACQGGWDRERAQSENSLIIIADSPNDQTP